MALSADGNTLAVGAVFEDNNATGINGDQFNPNATDSGAVYVFLRDGMSLWSQRAYVKASNTDPNDAFGFSVALSTDGNTLAVGAPAEDSNATGVGGLIGVEQANNSVANAGAVYLF